MTPARKLMAKSEIQKLFGRLTANNDMTYQFSDNLGRMTPSIPNSATVCSQVALAIRVSCLDNTALILRTYAVRLRKEQEAIGKTKLIYCL